MKGLKKLALATAVAAAPFAQAELTAMDDSMLEEMTGQAGVTIDVDLDMTIAEVRYTDEDGYGDHFDGSGATDAGYISLSNLAINGDAGAASIRGVTIDADGTDGLVIGFGQIGGTSNADNVAPADPTQLLTNIAASEYWTGVNVTGDIGINGGDAGSFKITNFTTFVPNALAMEGVQKFGYTLDPTDVTKTLVAVTDDTNDTLSGSNTAVLAGAFGTGGLIATEFGSLRLDPANAGVSDDDLYAVAKQNVLSDTSNGVAEALTDGAFVNAWVSISAGGAVDSDTDTVSEGITINGEVGFIMEEMAYIDDGNEFGVHNFTMFDTDPDGTITGFKVSGLKIDVVTRTADSNSQATQALQISGMKTEGTIAMGDIYVGDHEHGSLGALSIKDINMENTEIRIYGH